MVLRPFSQARAWRPAVVARLARTLGVMTNPTPRHSWIVLATAGGLLCYSAYSLLDALIQAYGTGLVEVLPRSRRLPRERVPWPNAWAYLLGTLTVSIASIMWLLTELRISRFLFSTILVYFLGVNLILLSGNLASLAGAAIFLGLLLSLPATFLLRRSFGSSVALWFWVLLVAAVFAVPFVG